MSLVIRLARVGKRGERKFRIVVKEKRSKRDGKAIEYLGSFEKSPKGGQNLKKDRYNYWVSVGAVPSVAVEEIFK
ncbi:MAG: 30S ribosomal protein S16 [Candidatus Woesebacteria bacterium GW2011_GWB1_38_5b]|uniref:30S ribosomal protein S16 n=1 Tax=Candidatus Woesebacteria bacterium GW2011_GWB1_38_5b TaxID=1618569 RepID=A0A0G0NDN8_9BACT|nr:MAG: 30S ribosomal protein S16 [Candidatus Woesebacteria bacterium GW2011_GWB1_38_5b]OGH47499.1 MAG: 30S ribosomal protein S16 [Candidatus Levybacteria bacterium RIFCSPLOWO2_01_FULL_39_10]